MVPLYCVDDGGVQILFVAPYVFTQSARGRNMERCSRARTEPSYVNVSVLCKFPRPFLSEQQLESCNQIVPPFFLFFVSKEPSLLSF